VRAILGQQVSVAAGRTLAARILARFGRRVGTGEAGLSHLFPTPRVLAGASLEGLGLTGVRARSINALARAVASGALDFAAPADEVAARLAALPGCGPWTASYISLRALGEPDAFPAGDLVLRRQAAGPAEPPLTSRALAERAEAWRPWRGYATLHLWSATETRSQTLRADKRG
jgi:AraC family transcriptional regulator of adaptative response / DNA-3-methyladenine glycosylase II